MREKLIQQGVLKLKQLGFFNVDKNNIIEYKVYRYYLKKMLLKQQGLKKEENAAIQELLELIKE